MVEDGPVSVWSIGTVLRNRSRCARVTRIHIDVARSVLVWVLGKDVVRCCVGLDTRSFDGVGAQEQVDRQEGCSRKKFCSAVNSSTREDVEHECGKHLDGKQVRRLAVSPRR